MGGQENRDPVLFCSPSFLVHASSLDFCPAPSIIALSWGFLSTSNLRARPWQSNPFTTGRRLSEDKMVSEGRARPVVCGPRASEGSWKGKSGCPPVASLGREASGREQPKRLVVPWQWRWGEAWSPVPKWGGVWLWGPPHTERISRLQPKWSLSYQDTLVHAGKKTLAASAGEP